MIMCLWIHPSNYRFFLFFWVLVCTYIFFVFLYFELPYSIFYGTGTCNCAYTPFIKYTYVCKSNFTLDLKDPTTNPIFCKPYPIVQSHMIFFLKELNHFIDKGVLEHVPRSEWAFPTFIIPKKDDRVHGDFRKLNNLLKRPRYFLTSIPEIM